MGIRTIYLIVILLLSAQISVANDVDVYQKCFGLLAGSRVDSKDPILKKILAKKISGADGCMELVSLGDLDEKTGLLKVKSSQSKRVLKTFNDFHRNWFSQYDFTTDTNCSRGTDELFDSGEAAYFVTKSLFSNSPYSSIVTSNQSLMAIRDSNTEAKRIRNTYHLTPSLRSAANRKLIIGQPDKEASDSENEFPHATPKLVDTGELVGIKSKHSDPIAGLAVFDDRGKLNNNLPAELDIHKNWGAGAISSVSYLLMNSGRGEKFRSDGGMDLRRRWSQHLIKDLLCRDLPVVRIADALPYLDSQGSSSLPFRGGISCMQCHSTMDQMARTTRNLIRERSANSCDQDAGFSFAYIREATVDQPPHQNEKGEWIDVSDKDYYRRPPEGKLYYRTSKGELLNQDVANIDELGEALAQNDDLYICAAKRYVQFFTGVDIPMFDPGDINAPDVNQAEQDYINFVHELGEDLKKDGNLKKLIKKIVSSKTFLNPQKRPER